MKVVARLDASARIGTGHWRRTSNLLSTLQPARFRMLVRTDAPECSLFSGVDVGFLGERDEFDALVDACRKSEPDLLLLDLLSYPPGYIRHLKEALRIPVVSFHEYCDWDGASDLVINYNLFDGFDEITDGRVLAGPNYCIIHTGVLSLPRTPSSEEMLVTFGGSDPSQYSSAFLTQVAPNVPEVSFCLHVGPLDPLRQSFGQRSLPTNVRLSSPTESFFSLLGRCRGAITAGGNTMYELIYLQRQPLVLAHNRHQDEFASNAARLGVAHHLGYGEHVDWVRLCTLLRAGKHHHSVPPRDLIDGQGTNRIAAAIRTLIS